MGWVQIVEWPWRWGGYPGLRAGRRTPTTPLLSSLCSVGARDGIFRPRPALDEVGVEREVATAAAVPREVLRHRAPHQLAPGLRLGGTARCARASASLERLRASQRRTRSRCPARRRSRRPPCRPARRRAAPAAACRSAGRTSASGRRARSATARGSRRRRPRAGAPAPRRSRCAPRPAPGAPARPRRSAASRPGSPLPCTSSCAPSRSSAGNAASTRSRPFCEVRRLTTPNSGASALPRQPRFGLQRPLALGLALRVIGAVARRQRRVARGVPRPRRRRR